MRRHLCPDRGTVYLMQCVNRGTVYLIQGVRRWFWGIHLLQRLRVPPGFPRLPRKPVVLLLQLGAPTLCLRKRTPQNHLFGEPDAFDTKRYEDKG